MDKTSVIELVRKCLKLGQSPNEHEAALALAKAQELLLKYNLGMIDVSADAREERPVGHETLTVGWGRWRKQLFYCIAELNFCYGLESQEHVYLVGRPHNTAAVREMLAWIIPQAVSLADKAVREYSGRANKVTYRYSFYRGITGRVCGRLRAARRGQEAQYAGTTALVVRSSEENKEYISGVWPRLRTLKFSVANHSREGYEVGHKAGESVSINPTSSQVKAAAHLLS